MPPPTPTMDDEKLVEDDRLLMAVSGEDDAFSEKECRKRKQSKAWEHYTLEHDPSGLLMAVCKYCQICRYDAKGRSGTSNLHRHLKVCVEYKKVRTDDTPLTKITQVEYRRMLAEAIIQHGYSFYWVEHEKNRKLHTRLNSCIHPISRNTTKSDCLELHNEMKVELKNVLKRLPGRICCTSDLWTAINTKGYLCLTAQYIDENWKIQSKVLSFRHCPPPHGGFELSVEMRNVFLDWGIENKLFSLTVDNATNNNTMISTLKQGVLKDMICQGKYFHIRCCAHILNLIVKDGLKVIKAEVTKVRDGVHYIVGSEGRIRKFQKCVKNFEVSISTKLSLDVATRWNSTYIMLDKAFKYRSVMTYYFSGIDCGSKYVLSCNEWAKIEKICSLLEPFNEVTEMFSGSDYPTANLYFPQAWKIHTRLKSIVACADADIMIPAVEMLQKFNKYWNEYVDVLGFAVMLDPRFKWRFVLYALTKEHGNIEGTRMANEVRIQFDELFKVYVGLARGNDLSRNESMPLENSAAFDGVQEFATLDQASTSEVDLYFGECSLPVSTKFDVLSYWQKKSSHYPILAAMARDVLAIPITSVASEPSFSMGGRILNKWRSSLLPKNVEALVTTQNWLNGYNGYGDVESLEEEEE